LLYLSFSLYKEGHHTTAEPSPPAKRLYPLAAAPA
jgi:hypothetical protein